MLDLLIQLTGLSLLISGLVVGYWLAARPYAGRLRPAQRAILLLTLLTLAGGFFGAPPWWLDLGSSFAWDLPPLASRLLAAAGWAFALACWLALRTPTQRHLRLIMLMLSIYLAPLAVAILLFHLDRFDPDAPITYAFFLIVGMMTLPAIWFLARPVGVAPTSPHTAVRPTRLVQVWLGMVAALTGAWGAALFVTAAGPSPLLWVWPQDRLASRLIAVMLLTIAGAALYSIRHAELAHTTLATLVLYGVGVVAAGLWNLTVGKPAPLAYVVVFGCFALGSVSLLLAGVAARMQRSSAIPPHYVLHYTRRL